MELDVDRPTLVIERAFDFRGGGVVFGEFQILMASNLPSPSATT